MTSDWEDALRPRATRTVLAAVSAELPHRLAEALVAAAGVDRRARWRNSAAPTALRLIDTLVRGPLPWTGDEGYKKGRSHRRRREPRRYRSADAGKPQAQGIVPLRRNAGCVRADRRLQLLVGVGDGTRRRHGAPKPSPYAYNA